MDQPRANSASRSRSPRRTGLPRQPLNTVDKQHQTHACCAFTVQGPQMALAMLRGFKPLENRSVRWRPGWYYLHCGQGRLPSDCSLPLSQTWPDAPAEDELPRSCIFGRVRLGRIVSSQRFEHPWALASLGKWAHIIEESLEFRQPIEHVKGKLGPWRACGGILEQVRVATAQAIRRDFSDIFPEMSDERPRGRIAIAAWPKRLPGKAWTPRRTAEEIPPTAAVRSCVVPRLAPHRGGTTKKREALASTPASSSGAVEQLHGIRQGPLCTAERRIAAGRTPARLARLLRMSLLHKPEPDLQLAAGLPPDAGLFAERLGVDVFIVSVFVRRGVPMADVVEIRDVSGCFVARFRDVRTTRRADLTNVGLHFHTVGFGPGRRSLRFTACKVSSCAPSAAVAGALQANQCAATLWHSALASPANHGTGTSASQNVCQIRPLALQAHLQACVAAGSPHLAAPRPDRARVDFVLDLPCPRQYTSGEWRCHTCMLAGRSATYPVTERDVKLAFPGVLAHKADKLGCVYFTRSFLLHVVQNFLESLNIRAVRRRIVDYYASNVLALNMGHKALWYLTAVPRCDMLRSISFLALRNFVEAAVLHMKKAVCVYSGSVIRGDGNYDLALRAAVRREDGKWTRPYSVALAWIGVDGALLQPISPSRSEGIQDVLMDLRSLASDHKAARLQAGIPLACAPPAFHATDVYGRHRLQLTRFWNDAYPELRTRVETPTPRANAQGVAVSEGGEDVTVISGDPMHNLYAFRRLVPPRANDASDLVHAHKDMMSRLGAPELPRREPRAPQISSRREPRADLSADGRRVLRIAVSKSAVELQVALHASPSAAQALREFLAQPLVADSPVWKECFRAKPPRAVVATVARRCKASLHESVGWRNYDSQSEFKREAHRIKKWFKPGRKQTRWRRGIARGQQALDRVQGLKSAWTRKADAHYVRLVKRLSLEGLWNSRRASLAMRGAGVPVQTGTVSVERLWNSLKDMLPNGGRRISQPWFRLLSCLMFLRHNHRHFSAGRIAPWAQRDSLIAQRIDALAMLARAAHEQSADTDLEHLESLFHAFQ